MNCQPGDLALILKAEFSPDLIGRVCTVVDPVPGHGIIEYQGGLGIVRLIDDWIIEIDGALRTSPDDWLLPIRPQSDEALEQTDELETA